MRLKNEPTNRSWLYLFKNELNQKEIDFFNDVCGRYAVAGLINLEING